ncbi:hypothetical protein [Tessaracoccus palaemonis]|uniref:Uncharacterized protein n=1 Tax=Tessaracoccus palaemonis TaxID=2829499 RepID=A0ABX8SKZ1_9ACTN|nr:hypothetical protein [Tessaracoccus palaemonis]QXT62823.1 hypothetical protein KDB89_14015 [Tessaracoccus palaemonis]
MIDNVTELGETLRVLIQVAMSWWVSTTVLCASILGALWVKRKDVKNAGKRAVRWLFGVVAVFFGSIIAFGFVAASTAGGLGKQLQAACDMTALRT